MTPHSSYSPIAFYDHFLPDSIKIIGTAVNVSTLLITVGELNNPFLVEEATLEVYGLQGLPSIDLNYADLSPAT